MGAIKRGMGCTIGLALLFSGACAGSKAQQPRDGEAGQLVHYKRTLQFLTDLDIGPDTLQLPDVINFPAFAADPAHAHWLTADEAVTLGMQPLCGVDADGTPAQLLGVKPLSSDITLALYQVFYGDRSPVVLVTYDTDGVVVDMMNAGVWAGVNTLYASMTKGVSCLGVDSTVMTLGSEGKFSLDRTLTYVQRQMRSSAVKPLWTYQSKFDYQVDTTLGTIKLLNRQDSKPGLRDDNIVRRELEELTWAPIQDEDVMARYEEFVVSHSDDMVSKQLTSFYNFALLDRFERAPWSTLEWLYYHPESRVYHLFRQAVDQRPYNQERLLKFVKSVQDPQARDYWKAQFNFN